MVVKSGAVAELAGVGNRGGVAENAATGAGGSGDAREEEDGAGGAIQMGLGRRTRAPRVGGVVSAVPRGAS